MDSAKLFVNGRSQAVRLPRKYRFEGSEVFIRRDEATGEVILSDKATTWEEIFALRDENDSDMKTFMIDRKDDPAPIRDLFDEIS